jgi:hypothetical protein
VVPYHRFRLQRISNVWQLEFDRDPFSGLKLGCQDGSYTTLSNIERPTRNAIG